MYKNVSPILLGLPSGPFPSGLHTKTLYVILPLPIRASCCVHLILLDLITRPIFGEVIKTRRTGKVSSVVHIMETKAEHKILVGKPEAK
jgi:hypothetical protein